MDHNSNESSESSGSGFWRWGAAALGVALLGISAYSVAGLQAERSRSEQLSATNVSLRGSLNDVQNQLQAVSDKLQTLAQQRAEEEKARQAVKPVVRTRPARAVTAAPDPRWKQMQDKLSDQQKQIDTTQQDLASTKQDVAGTRQDIATARDDFNKANQDLSGRLDSTRGELSGSIAKTRYAWYMLGVGMRRVQRMQGVQTVAARCAEILSSAHLQIDGEYAGRQPARLETVPGALTLLMPPKYG